MSDTIIIVWPTLILVGQKKDRQTKKAFINPIKVKLNKVKQYIWIYETSE